jgi:hypothetical protein
VKPLARRQKHCLVALLELEEDQSLHRPITAGDVAYRLGFSVGPSQGGNGAKDGRSFSGYGPTGKWVTFSLLGLAKRGLLLRFHSLFDASRQMSNSLTEEGRAAARDLREAGWTAQEVERKKGAYLDPRHARINEYRTLPAPGEED